MAAETMQGESSFEEVAPCGTKVSAGACDGCCTDCAEFPAVCELYRLAVAEAHANGKPTSAAIHGRHPCPDGMEDDVGCVGCAHLRRAEVSP